MPSFFFQAEDGIRDYKVTGVQTCALPICAEISGVHLGDAARDAALFADIRAALLTHRVLFFRDQDITRAEHVADRKSTRLNSSHLVISYAVFCLKKKKNTQI